MAVYIILLTGIALNGFYLFEYKGYGGRWLSGRCTKRQERFTAGCLTAACLIFTLMAAMRYGIGFDYYSYRDIYQTVDKSDVNYLFHVYRNEWLFYLLCKLCTTLSLSYTAFLAVVSLFIHAVAMQFIYRFSKIPWVSVYLYAAFQFLAHNMNLMRQSIAVSFFLLAYPFLVKRQLGRYLVLMVIGGLFHNSLFFIIPAYFLLPLKNTSKRMAVSALCFAAVYLFLDPIITLLFPLLPPQYVNYLSSGIYWQGNNFTYTILPTVYFALTFLFRKRLPDECPVSGLTDAPRSWVCRSIAVNSAFATAIVCFFITKHFILERFSVYPFILALLVIPEIVSSFHEENHVKEEHTDITGDRFFLSLFLRNKETLILALFLGFATVYFIFAAVKGFHHVYPYVSLWQRVGVRLTIKNLSLSAPCTLPYKIQDTLRLQLYADG